MHTQLHAINKIFTLCTATYMHKGTLFMLQTSPLRLWQKFKAELLGLINLMLSVNWHFLALLQVDFSREESMWLGGM